MNIVLIGYRGTGKSTLAKEIAERLSMKVVCMDEEIVKREGMSIPEIVETHGWDHFRDIETQVARDIEHEDGLIIDAGGGIIVRQENIDILKKNGLIFLLVADEKTIANRIVYDHQRPSLTGAKSFVDEISEVLKERTPKYEAAADHVIDTAEMNVREAADAVVEIVSREREK